MKIATKSENSVWAGWYIIFTTILILGIFFRFANLDQKVYWHDETYTSLWISGYSRTEVTEGIFTSSVISVEDVNKYQHLKPGIGVVDVVKHLAQEDAQHPPLYYILVRLWVDWFGDSVAVTRSFSAVISLLAFPCIYWLCLELFKSPLTGYLAVALIAISPFQVLYAQEAREYILWSVTILLSSAALLRAMRQHTKLSWVTYTVTIALGLYTFLFTVLVMFAHGSYVFIVERFRITKRFIAYLCSSLLGMIAFLPWLIHINEINAAGWTSQEMDIHTLARIWVGNISRVFFDLNFDSNNPLLYTVPPTLMILLLIGYSLYFLCRKAPKQSWLFILMLGGVTTAFLILPDLVSGGRRSSVARYLFPGFISMQLAVAYLLSNQIISAKVSLQKLWIVLTAVLISAGVISCAVSSQADSWWLKKYSHHHPQTARIINEATNPLLVSSKYNANQGEILSFSHLLDSKVRLQLVLEPNIPQIPDGFSDIFLFNPSKQLIKGITKEYNYKINSVYKDGRLWRIDKN